jgi:polar amino acid transport system substrate-binding protein
MKPIRPASPTLLALALAGALISACTAASPSLTPSPSVSASVGASPDQCATENLATKEPGVLTVGTDNPAFPPYFAEPSGDQKPTEPWELGDPTNGRGFESAVAYAVAEELGFAEEDVTWVVVPFANSYQPGPKAFDFYLAQVSYTPERAEQVDMSDGYFFGNQALLAIQGTPIAEATTIEEVAQYRLGAASATTSLDYILEKIQPATEPRVYDTNDAAAAGLDARQVDGILVDLPTAFLMSIISVDDGVVVGQFPSDPNEQEHFSLVLEKDSPLTACVNEAIAAITDSGELEQITDRWMGDYTSAPTIE